MEYMRYAVYVLKCEVNKIQEDMKFGHNLPEMEKENMKNLQQLYRAIWDIERKFEL